jgi:hypothetical protein
VTSCYLIAIAAKQLINFIAAMYTSAAYGIHKLAKSALFSLLFYLEDGSSMVL